MRVAENFAIYVFVAETLLDEQNIVILVDLQFNCKLSASSDVQLTTA